MTRKLSFGVWVAKSRWVTLNFDGGALSLDGGRVPSRIENLITKAIFL